MINNLDDVIRWLKDNGLTHWEVKTSDNSVSYIFKTNEDEAEERRFERFRTVMGYSHGERFIILAKSDPSAKKGIFRTEFSNRINNHASQSPTIGNIVPNSDLISRTELELLLKDQKRDWEIEQIKKENQELKQQNKELQTPMREFLEKITPFVQPAIGVIVNKLIPGSQIAVAGTQTNQIPNTQNYTIMEDPEEIEIEMTEQESSEVLSCLNDWKESDTDWLLLLGKISKMAKTKHPLYDTAKTMLINLNL